MNDAAEEAVPERKRGSGVKLVYEMLRDEILTLALPPGKPIDEVNLAERFGMSRTPIREALVRLAGEGLVETLPNRSAIVANIDFLKLHTFFDAITLMYRVTTRLAAQFHQAEDLELIRAHQVKYAAAVAAQDPLAMIVDKPRLSRRRRRGRTKPVLHRTDPAPAGRRAAHPAAVLPIIRRPACPKNTSDEHEEIIAAIAARDVDLCDRLARAHADQIVRQIQQFFAREMRQDLAL